MTNPYSEIAQAAADSETKDTASALHRLADAHCRLASSTERIADLLDKATIEEQGSGSSLIRLLVDRG